jgi:hypothetical protein
MLTKILLAFTIVCNFATLFGLWVAYEASPATLQAQIGHALLLCGAVASILGYLAFAYFVMRPVAHKTQEQSIATKDATRWKTLYEQSNKDYLEANKDRADFREKYAEAANELNLLKAAQKPLPVHPLPALREKILLKCTELQAFIGGYGPDVMATRREGESVQQFMDRLENTKLKETRIKFTSDYLLNHESSVLQLRDEMGASCAITDDELDRAIEFSRRGAGAAEQLSTVIERFWSLALKVNV